MIFSSVLLIARTLVILMNKYSSYIVYNVLNKLEGITTAFKY